jgi:hypothetical protein
MVVLSASELPPETLCAGGTIEYYDSAFVCGDPNGFRRAVVTRNDDRAEVDFPVALDTMDVIPGDVMMKRGIDACGKHDPHASLWRKLRTYQLDAGTFAAATKSSALKKALAEAVTAAVESAREALRDPREKIVPEPPQSSTCSSPDRMTGLGDVPGPSAPSSMISAPADGGGASPTYSADDASEGRFKKSSGCSSPVRESALDDVTAPSAPGSAISAPAISGGASPTSRPSAARQ